MKTTSSNYFKAADGGKEIFLSRPNYLDTLGFVLVIYLDKIIQHVVSFNCPHLESCFFLQCCMRQQRAVEPEFWRWHFSWIFALNFVGGKLM